MIALFLAAEAVQVPEAVSRFDGVLQSFRTACLKGPLQAPDRECAVSGEIGVAADDDTLSKSVEAMPDYAFAESRAESGISDWAVALKSGRLNRVLIDRRDPSHVKVTISTWSPKK